MDNKENKLENVFWQNEIKANKVQAIALLLRSVTFITIIVLVAAGIYHVHRMSSRAALAMLLIIMTGTDGMVPLTRR